jgi:hypothetical protein
MPDTDIIKRNGVSKLPDRQLPDPAICRAKYNGLDFYPDCLVEGPFYCKHALSFGFGHYCTHPDRKEIIARTEAGEGK